MNALIIVDVQNDFLPGGSLAVPDGNQIVAIVNRLMSKFDLVVATQDWHPPDHGSFVSQHPDSNVGDEIELDGLRQIVWPDHCIENSIGAEFSSELDTTQIDHVFKKGTAQNVDSYSGFFDNDHRHATGLGDFLKSRGAENVYILGLATDYCVKFTALDAVKLGFDTWLVIDGCRGVDLIAGDIDAAIEEMKIASVKITSSDNLIHLRKNKVAS